MILYFHSVAVNNFYTINVIQVLFYLESITHHVLIKFLYGIQKN